MPKRKLPVTERNLRPMSRASLRNLSQNRNLTEEEFNEKYNMAVFGVTRDQVIQERFDRLYTQFENEYDLSDMLANDRVILENLIRAMIQLQDYEMQLDIASKTGINLDNITIIKELNTICKGLRYDISQMQDDLKIKRKSRQTDKEQTALMFLEDLKTKAKQFSQQKMKYIFCEQCGTLLATVWFLIPDYALNDVKVRCNRILETGEQCGWSKRYTAKELTDMGGSNRPELLPESIR